MSIKHAFPLDNVTNFYKNILYYNIYIYIYKLMCAAICRGDYMYREIKEIQDVLLIIVIDCIFSSHCSR